MADARIGNAAPTPVQITSVTPTVETKQMPQMQVGPGSTSTVQQPSQPRTSYLDNGFAVAGKQVPTSTVIGSSS